jgi:hypothetical protein
MALDVAFTLLLAKMPDYARLCVLALQNSERALTAGVATRQRIRKHISRLQFRKPGR